MEEFQMENSTKCSKMMKAIWNEKKLVASWIKQYDIDGIISDNRLGVLIKKILCIHNASAQCNDWKYNLVNEQTTSKYIKNIQNAGFLMFSASHLAGELSHSEQLYPYT
jgi:hypothetical protein